METHYGKEVAGEFDRFEAAYRLIKNDRGCFIDGSTPDGRTTGTCDRCGTAIMNVFVFASSKRPGFMHVGKSLVPRYRTIETWSCPDGRRFER